jgi:GNAT superfamily N-acetyltransferase
MADALDEIRIRPARLGDAARIAVLSGQLGYPASQEEMAERLVALLRRPRENRIFVATEPSCGVIGWLHVSATALLEVPLRAEVNGLIVSEEQRSSGLGAKLLAAAEEWACRKGCKSMSVRSNVVRERAHAFYVRAGYEHYKTQKAFRKKL